MRLHHLLTAGMLLLGGCAYEDGWYGGGGGYYAGGGQGYYDGGGAGYYGSPYQPGSPVYGSPYVSGPLYSFSYYDYGDDDWPRKHKRRHDGDHDNGNNGGNWNHGGGDCRPGTPNCPPGPWPNGGHGWSGQKNNPYQGGPLAGFPRDKWKQQNQKNWPREAQDQGNNWKPRNGQNQGGGNGAWVYQSPRNPNGSGAPAFQPRSGSQACGTAGAPPCQ